MPTAWDPDANGSVRTLALSSDGATVYAGGNFTSFNGGAVTRNYIAAIDVATGVPTAWDPDSDNYVYTLVLSSDGATVYTGGNFTSFNGGAVTRNYIAAIDAATGVPTAWDPNPDSNVQSLAISPDNSILYMGGHFRSLVGGTIKRVYGAAVTLDTGVPTNWDPFLEWDIYTFSFCPDSSKMFIGGNFYYVNAQERNNLAAINVKTGRFTSWNPDSDNEVNVLALSSDGATVYAGGNFTSFNGSAVTRNYIAAIDAVTGVPTVWDPDADGPVITIVLSSDGATVYAGGNFTSFNGGAVTRNHIAAIDTATGAPTGWDPDASGNVYTLVLSLDGATVYVGGNFTTFNAGAVTRHYIAAIDAATGVPTAWDPDADDSVYTLILSSDGATVFTGGGFDSFNAGAVERHHIAAIDATTGEPTGWDPDAGGDVFTLVLSPDGATVYAGGEFWDFLQESLTRVGFGSIDVVTGEVW